MDPVTSTPPQQALSKYTPQPDASKFIRTYAKDVAQLTNTPYVEPATEMARTVTAPQPLPTVSGESTEAGVTVKEFDSSPVNQSGGVSPKEFEQEVVSLSASDSEGIFNTPVSSSAIPPSSPPTASDGAGAQLAESYIPLQSIFAASTLQTPAPGAPVDEEREAILARLRAKLASHKEEPVVSVTPPPSMPEPVSTPVPAPEPIPIPTPVPTIREAAPDFTPTPEPSLPSMPVVRERVYAPVSAPGAPTPSPLHTYSGDFSDRIDQQKSSTFSVLAAQSDAGQSTISSTRPRRTFVPLAAGVAMLVIGIGAVAGAYIFTHKNSSIGTALSVPSLIRFDESVEVKGTGTDLMKAIANVAEGGSVSGNVVVTYVTGTDATSTSGIPQQGGTLIRALSLPAPDILLRNIVAESTVGTIRAGTESRPFLILKVSSYERTFAGMLAWEQTMPRDLGILYPAYTSLPVTLTTTPSTTPVFAPAPSFTPTFTDGVVANYDVRVLRDATGRSLLLYGYKGKDLLIIARDEAAFTELVSRLTTAGT